VQDYVAGREKKAKLLTPLHGWIRAGHHDQGIPFQEFESVVGKLQPTFTALLGGWGLLSPYNILLRRQPLVVYFHRNELLQQAIANCCTILRDNTPNTILETCHSLAQLCWCSRCLQPWRGWSRHWRTIRLPSHSIPPTMATRYHSQHENGFKPNKEANKFRPRTCGACSIVADDETSM
jgi:hypothetical protein